MAERVLRQIHSLNHISQFVFVAVISSECLGQTQSVVSTFAVSDTSLSGYNRYSSTHILCLCRHAVVVIAVLRQSERLVALCLGGHFSTAQHLCQQRLRWSQELAEVSSVYGCQLWLANQRELAMRVWGEQVLPFASQTFWQYFSQRILHEDDSTTDLLVKWLPFNDVSKVR
eukprot:m.150670 g.150670  ORF g.150670 m.150670 type:complete len:172 (-) comp14236_c0_seq8:446-961(-)